jgi:putative transposase
MILKATREHATNNSQTYFLTSKTWEGRRLFRAEPWARLFFEILLSHRGEPYLLHEFVLMPDHFHLLLTPSIPLERAMQLIKGGFSFRAKREFASNAEIWQRGFSDHRIRDAEDYETHVHYIHLNPVKKHLCQKPGEYKYSSAYPGWRLDPIPQGLKPRALVEAACGTAKAVPFQNNGMIGGAGKAAPFQNNGMIGGAGKAVPFQNKDSFMSNNAGSIQQR